FVSLAYRSPAELSGGSRQESVLLLRLRPWRRCDSPRRVVSRCPLRKRHRSLRHWNGLGSVLPDVATFYQMQLHRHADAVDYLLQRGLHRAELIEQLRIGYAPGRCLRSWLTSLGYPLESLQQAGPVGVGTVREAHEDHRQRFT